MLAGGGAAGSIVLLFVADQATRMPLSTAGQLVVVAGLIAWLGPRGLRRSLAASRPLAPAEAVDGQPTPLWQAPLAVAALTGAAGLLAGWDAGLRVTLGCVLVGLGQAVLLERIVGARERTSGRLFFRVAGSSWIRGTRLGYRAATDRASSARLTAQPPPTSASPSRRRPPAAATRPATRITVLARAVRTRARSGGSARAK